MRAARYRWRRSSRNVLMSDVKSTGNIPAAPMGVNTSALATRARPAFHGAGIRTAGGASGACLIPRPPLKADSAHVLTWQPLAEYLSAALEDPDIFLVAVRDVARARGMAQLARDTGLGRESLYKALAPGAKPRYDTLLKVLNASGVKLHVEPAKA